jgi:hypothetical protein
MMSPYPDGQMMIGTYKNDGDARREIDKSQQVCMHIPNPICHQCTLYVRV